ncbi:hypothetical protein [Paraherbaspirillum soli]|uniref:Uncharacterized protein n=1 Tax=Paraherbaspirillum soli TaxID=631222 RepID=A0ABW0MC28_9BURK
MKRILLSAMEQIEGKYWYKNSVFSGIGFSIDFDGAVSASELADGRIVHPYYSVCVPDNNEYIIG